MFDFFNIRVTLTVRHGFVHVLNERSKVESHVPCESLAHPRTLMGDFHKIERAFQKAIEQVITHRFLKIAPMVTVVLPDAPEGGYTNVEIRAFKEAAFGAGAREVQVYSGNYNISAHST